MPKTFYDNEGNELGVFYTKAEMDSKLDEKQNITQYPYCISLSNGENYINIYIKTNEEIENLSDIDSWAEVEPYIHSGDLCYYRSTIDFVEAKTAHGFSVSNQGDSIGDDSSYDFQVSTVDIYSMNE